MKIYNQYLPVILITLIVLSTGLIIKRIGEAIIKRNSSGRKEYRSNQAFKVLISIIEIVILFFIWCNYFAKVMTLISVLSGAIAIALRDIILNFFCGILIYIKKPFKVEDRIEIDGVRGDVMSIHSLTFEILEVSSKDDFGQSTGVVITFPNSVIFSKEVKNYNKGFKYIWNEIVVKIKLDSDLEKNKNTIYKILEENDIIKEIPKKMKREVAKVNSTERVYFNEYKPVIYTRVNEKCIELYVRYLMHPKKVRFIESFIWEKIYQESRNNNIDLYIEKEI